MSDLDFVFFLCIFLAYVWFLVYKKCYIHHALKVKVRVVKCEYHYRGFNDTIFSYKIEHKNYIVAAKTVTSHRKGKLYTISVDPNNYEHVASVKDFRVCILLSVVPLLIMFFQVWRPR